ncbi:hypothetical protein HZA33_04925 [Candidatus Pacearchaeota archaeon]|nr:hypothetical protein [Candidatus Pacearchaeota archaeon]
MALIRDDTGAFFFDSWGEALKQEEKKDNLYLVHCREIKKAPDGTRYQSGYYVHHLTGNPEDERDIQNLQNIVSNLLQKGSDIDEIQLVERTYRAGHTSESGIETEYWAVPEYKVFQRLDPHEFLKLGKS